MLTIEGWEEFAEDQQFAINGFYNYLLATENIVDRLEEIMAYGSDLTQFKDRIEALIEERKKFMAHAEANYPK